MTNDDSLSRVIYVFLFVNSKMLFVLFCFVYVWVFLIEIMTEEKNEVKKERKKERNEKLKNVQEKIGKEAVAL